MRFYLLFIGLLHPCIGQCDLIKPALIEISVFADNTLEIEIRASLEAILTGINAQYKNTQAAPQAADYDRLRQSSAAALHRHFAAYSAQFIDHLDLQANQTKIALSIESIEVPEAGYTQVPRISTLHLSGILPKDSDYLQWYYPEKFSDYALRIRQIDRKAKQWHWGQWQWIRDGSPSAPIPLNLLPAAATSLGTLAQYLWLGFLHIIPKGSDHLLFILGLFLRARQWRPLLLQITAFTAAHSVTLGLAAWGIVTIAPQIVEPLIALSIAFIGFECLRNRPIGKLQLLTIMAFGLLHGLGLATAMSEFNLSRDLFLIALLGFNLGVEVAQVSALLGAWFCAWLALGWWISKTQYQKYCVKPLATLICLVGLFWLVERIQFFG